METLNFSNSMGNLFRGSTWKNPIKFHGKKPTWNSMKFLEKKTLHRIPCPKPRQNSMEFHRKFFIKISLHQNVNFLC